MAKSKFTIEEKKQLVKAYCKENRKRKNLSAEMIAAWCRQNYGIEIHGYDFRRPPEFREWFLNGSKQN